MRNLSTFLLLFSMNLGLAKADIKFDESLLKVGQCYSNPDSKNYLSGLKKTESQNYDHIKSEIGIDKINQLQDTDSKNFYFCQATCRRTTGELDKIWITQSDDPARFASMDGFLCKGIQVEQVNIVGDIFGLQPVIYPFWSFETDFSEIHSWLKGTKFSLEQNQSAELKKKFSTILTQISAAYIQSGSLILQEAGQQLWEIASDSELGRKIIAEDLYLLRQNNWENPQDFTNPEFFVLNILKQNGRFLEYLSSQ